MVSILSVLSIDLIIINQFKYMYTCINQLIINESMVISIYEFFFSYRAESLDLYSSFQTDQTENAKKAIPTASISDQGKNVFYINININK